MVLLEGQKPKHTGVPELKPTVRRRKGNRGIICPLILSGTEVEGSNGPPLFQALDSAPEYKHKMGLISTHGVIFSLKERRNACRLSQYG